MKSRYIVRCLLVPLLFMTFLTACAPSRQGEEPFDLLITNDMLIDFRIGIGSAMMPMTYLSVPEVQSDSEDDGSSAERPRLS